MVKVKRKLRKGSHGYLTVQIPECIRTDLGLTEKDILNIDVDENKRIILEKVMA
jgi:bifunctional DNA-binding transcriptional regulator/antitoxin component of YhaV-PrlF toxin-antitoxin module